MGMQVQSLSTGANSVAPAQYEVTKEKLPPLPMEQKAAAEESQIIPGIQKIQENAQKSALNKTASDLEQISLAFNRRLKFVVDQESNDIIIKVIDNETDKVIKVLPPEELQRLHSKIKETMGFLLDTMV